MHDRILVATDLDPSRTRVLADAVRPFLGAGRVLALCHVRWDAERFLSEGKRGDEQEQLDEEGMRLLEEWSFTFLPDHPRELFVEAAPVPLAGIDRVAQRWNADLIALAASGSHGLWRTLTGSVDDLVVRNVRANVLVARPSPSTGVVLAATDLSNPSFSAVASAADEATRRGRELVVVHVVDGSHPPLGVAGAPGHEARTGAASWVRHALARTGSKGEVVVLEGSAAPAILELAASMGAELVVVAATGHGGLSRALLGSVSEEVMRAAPCSVLIVRR